SIAKLNMARSLVRPSTINRVLIDQTCFGRSGGLAPISLPLFQGVRGASFNRRASLAGMVVLLGYWEPGACSGSRAVAADSCPLSEVCGHAWVTGPPLLTPSGHSSRSPTAPQNDQQTPQAW